MQALFAQHQGEVLARTSVDSRSPRDNGVAASATCQDPACASLSIKVSSLALNPADQGMSLEIHSIPPHAECASVISWGIP